VRKAVAAFRRTPQIACLQARLAFYNARQCWLAKMFALEYAGWFAIMLPGLARLGIPIPLGGTSNHFRTAVLREVGGWDAYNVTEDADLGLRLAREGHRVGALDSTTYEEANSRLASWVRQRSRWLKGYAQTALVHAREPAVFVRQVGLARYLASLTFVGGAVATALVSPLMWVLAILWLITGGGPQGAAYDAVFLTSLVFGTSLLTVLAALAAVRVGERDLSAWGLTVFFYWLLASVGAYRGIWQLINGRSSFWEKTEHGLEWRGASRLRFALPSRAVLVHCTLVLLLLIVSACAALANPWLQDEGRAEFLSTVRVMRSADGFATDGKTVAAFEGRLEYGATQAVTAIMDGEVKTIDEVSGAVLERARIGARVSVLRWNDGVLSIEGVAGTGSVRAGDGNPFFASLHATGEIRVLAGQGFTLFGSHAWAGVEAGWRGRGGPPADEWILDGIAGIEARDDLLLMAQYFGITSANNAFAGYRPYDSGKAQLSLAHEVAPGVWFQAGGIVSVHGDDAGATGGMLALWWRF
jgi:hypothetical protein